MVSDVREKVRATREEGGREMGGLGGREGEGEREGGREGVQNKTISSPNLQELLVSLAMLLDSFTASVHGLLPFVFLLLPPPAFSAPPPLPPSPTSKEPKLPATRCCFLCCSRSVASKVPERVRPFHDDPKIRRKMKS